jgi:hypothetical protein
MTTPKIDFLETESTKVITKEGVASEVPLEKPKVVEVVKVDIDASSEQFWAQQSRELQSYYALGTNLGKFGVHATSTENVLIRLSECLIELIKFESSKDSKSTENLSCHFSMLSSIMKMISKEFDSMKLEDVKAQHFLATLHGFIESLTKNTLDR